MLMPRAAFSTQHRVLTVKSRQMVFSRSTLNIEDEQFNLDIKMIPALAFVPEDAVEEAFETLADNISADAQPILDYFEDTFIGRPTDEVLSSAFIFGICMTVQYKSLLAPTTTQKAGTMDSSQQLGVVIPTSGSSQMRSRNINLFNRWQWPRSWQGMKLLNAVNIETVPDVFYTLWKTTTTVMLQTIFVVLPIMSTCEFIDFEIKWLDFSYLCFYEL